MTGQISSCTVVVMALLMSSTITVHSIRPKDVRNAFRRENSLMLPDRSPAMDAYIFEFYDSDSSLLSPVDRVLKKRSISEPLMDNAMDFVDNRFDVIEVNEIVRDNQLSLDLQELIIESLNLLQAQQVNYADELKNNQAASLALEMIKSNLNEALYDLQKTDDALTMHRVLNEVAQANNFYQALREDLLAADGNHNVDMSLLGPIKPLFDLYVAIQEQFDRVKKSGSMSDSSSAYIIIKSIADKMVESIKATAVVDANNNNGNKIISNKKINNVDMMNAVVPVVGPANKPAGALMPPKPPKKSSNLLDKQAMAMPKLDIDQKKSVAINEAPFNMMQMSKFSTESYQVDDNADDADDANFAQLLLEY